MTPSELLIMGAYLSGAVCIVLFTLSIGWIVVWKFVLAKMPFIQELFDLKPKSASATATAAAEDAEKPKSISFQQRYEAYRRKRQEEAGL
ncbi:hypothetical protein P43SY_010462 [Pythium insidiosum]|uniref:Transmembrane protein n=1 Tax=Pythium insidiosum TaxID=114742 RepID=A0AAD5L832_PYTIN|nr:hypothetical protein P43SY_010462 [Pythium insidiosum]